MTACKECPPTGRPRGSKPVAHAPRRRRPLLTFSRRRRGGPVPKGQNMDAVQDRDALWEKLLGEIKSIKSGLRRFGQRFDKRDLPARGLIVETSETLATLRGGSPDDRLREGICPDTALVSRYDEIVRLA